LHYAKLNIGLAHTTRAVLNGEPGGVEVWFGVRATLAMLDQHYPLDVMRGAPE
jgi:hypothetical protein